MPILVWHAVFLMPNSRLFQFANTSTYATDKLVDVLLPFTEVEANCSWCMKAKYFVGSSSLVMFIKYTTN